MATNGIVEVVEALSEAIVFLEPGELNGLADCHSQLEEIGAWAKEAEKPRTAAAVVAARSLIERIILQECDNPERAVEVVAETVSSLQRVTRDGVDDDYLEFPHELAVPTTSRSGAVPSGSGSGTPHEPVQSAVRPFKVELPPYVDEAIFSEFLNRQDSVLEEIETALLAMEQGANESEQRTLARHLHTLKGETALLGLSDIEQLCHKAEDLLDRDTSSDAIERMLALKDWMKQAFDAYGGKGGVPPAVDGMLEILAGARDPGALSPALEAPTDVHESPRETYGQTEASAPPLEAPSPPAPRQLTGDRELIADFIVEAAEHLDICDVQLLTLEVDPHNQAAVDAVFRAFHTIKGVCGFIDLKEMQALAHESENLLDQSRKGQITLEGPYLDIIFDAIDMLKRLLEYVRDALKSNGPLESCIELDGLIQAISDMAHGRTVTTWRHGAHVSHEEIAENLRKSGEEPQLGNILVEMGAVSPDSVESALVRQDSPPVPVNGNGGSVPVTRPPIGEVLVKQGEVDARTVAQALRTQKSIRSTDGATPAQSASPAETSARANAAGNVQPDSAMSINGANEAAAQGGEGGGFAVRETVKVDASRLDQLVDMIGELVIAESMVCQSQELVSNLSTELSRHVNQLDKITRELQEMAMGLRMVPIRSTFQKMARLVRDVAKKTGKEVNFSMQGEETELDKTVVDRIGDPLVHMIRNAVDHGLETSGEQRRAAGKPSAGSVSLRAYHSGGNIQIEIADDGRGLDRGAILNKARERGLISDNGDSMTNKDVWQLIFEPGFSTAKQLTEVSGRGVGMDVVKRNIEALRGEIDIHSEAGKGSRFTIRLPLTLAIIDGMVIRTGTERFIIPTLSIVVSVRPKKSDLGTVVGVAETMRLQGEIIPLFRLYELFDLSGARECPTEATVVVLENAGKRVGLLIDEILGQQQIVIKSLGSSLRGARGIAGGAIMPDGRVGLIIDIGELIKLATEAVPA